MNANELADYITENSYIGTVTMEDVATMLRQFGLAESIIKQQQAEIGCYKIELELHRAMIQDLEKVIKIKERDYSFMKDLAIGEEARAKVLEKQLEDCTCQGGHSEAYLKAKGRMAGGK